MNNYEKHGIHIRKEMLSENKRDRHLQLQFQRFLMENRDKEFKIMILFGLGWTANCLWMWTSCPLPKTYLKKKFEDMENSIREDMDNGCI